ncbi:hypothetical protein BO83DRAFT_453652 [Aspergillus eucalypticola CBS 122712]|uniref:P-loop containing nucleoside triphosphate hydrolase protein n=1 Tax=Aspergillus eucalypticola (strain CBS 122712 / IBT 29274) TaxID=1448314 RepID=A0A317US67_ASPEC|nr:uncharacterized protein BO83DRAFT_453652 [Aspergillus eucalypticola CBS 122712]PWY64814.1 hypothetical protein BO83DRAFT_453652 [Aspergillus eucalypticola CBS 122712]
MVALFDEAVTFDSFPGTGRSADSEDGSMGSKQCSGNLTNLMAVDVKRVSDIVSNSFSVYETPLRLLISSVVLIRLVGWQSLFVSILILFISWPLNNYAIERYSRSQKELMDYRDRKLASVTEALHGIRQIKFSATEEQWEEKINALRAGELECPSVVTAGSNCIRSAKRLSEYLDTLQHLPAVLPSRSIDFCEASLTWRGSSGYNAEVLRNANMSIPRNCLTLITGPTGAGKSLLLAAMLGECDILNGTVKTPTGREWTPISEKYHEWLLEDTIAYVAQTPWIEALTIRDNVLFGLPFDARRYTQVIFACALESDLQAMVDGDETQLGPNGVNLSGGQKARLCLARALYSRATVLLLDDIFSSVDVHTAAHLCHYALAGPLARDRTRILATHHVSLCRDHAQGIVHVNGATAHFNPVANPETQDEVDDSWTDHLDMKPFVKGVSHSSSDNDATVRSSRKFIVEETREKGAVRWTVLQDYIQQSGTRSYWMCLVMAFLSYSVLMLSRSQSFHSQASDEKYNVSYYAKIYITLSVLVCTVGATRSYFAMIGSLRASEVLFRCFLHQVLRMPLRWIDTVPLGRILNRFSDDFNLVDSQLGDDMRAILSYGMDVLMAVYPSLIINPLSLISSFILGLITARNSSRQRLYRRARTKWHSWLFNQWLAVRLDMIGAVFTAICAAAVVFLEVEASIARFAINSTLKFTQSISFRIRSYASLELDLHSVERFLEYCHMETESDGGNPTPAGWPYDGTLEVRDLSVQYAPDIEPALHNVTFRVEIYQRDRSAKDICEIPPGQDLPPDQTTRSFDLLLPGIGEVCSGGLREHRLDILIDTMRKKRFLRGQKPGPVPERNAPVDAKPYPYLHSGEELQSVEWFADLRRWGTSPHGGFGIGFERLLQYLTGAGSVREVISFPRYFGQSNERTKKQANARELQQKTKQSKRSFVGGLSTRHVTTPTPADASTKNDRYLGKDKISVPFFFFFFFSFFFGNPDYTIRCFPGCEGEQGVKYPPVSVG